LIQLYGGDESGLHLSYDDDTFLARRCRAPSDEGFIDILKTSSLYITLVLRGPAKRNMEGVEKILGEVARPILLRIVPVTNIGGDILVCFCRLCVVRFLSFLRFSTVWFWLVGSIAFFLSSAHFYSLRFVQDFMFLSHLSLAVWTVIPETSSCYQHTLHLLFIQFLSSQLGDGNITYHTSHTIFGDYWWWFYPQVLIIHIHW